MSDQQLVNLVRKTYGQEARPIIKSQPRLRPKPIILARRAHANVDQCEYLACELVVALCSRQINTDILNKLLALPDNQRHKIFQGLNGQQIIAVVQPLVDRLAEISGSSASTAFTVVHNTDNGRSGDLIISGKVVEIKFGSSTEANPGFSTIAKIFPQITTLQNFRDTPALKTDWHTAFLRDKTGVAELRRAHYMGVTTELQTVMGKPLGLKGQYILDCFLRGVTSQREIEAAYLAGNHTSVIQLYLGKDGTWYKQTPPLDNVGRWQLDNAYVSESNRIILRFINRQRSIAYTWTQNWKNNFEFPNGEKIEARHGLGRDSWIVKRHSC